HGDVGSGKTMVATHTMLRAIEEGSQAVLMAPTEVLADQHYLELSQRLSPLGVDVRLLKGSQPAGEKRAVLEAAAKGRADLVVGTHALIQEGVRFHDLRVAVVDEQHRFGVRQRDAMLAADAEGMWPHSLHMSATPIPRTLSLTLYGDLDVSTLDEMPPGRTPVTTRLVFPGSEGKMWSFVRQQLDQGRQAYVVCPLIEESDFLEAASARQTHDLLAQGELAGYRLRLLHGGLRPAEKADAMAAYAAGEADVLVSTTVIEVGVDVPNATVMVIMGARRFGLSQLHQLRGRVGRGGGEAYCFVMVETDDPAALERMAVFARTSDGFALAEADLAARGEGQLFGERQSGLGDLQVASLLRDRRLLERARREATDILRRIAVEPASPMYALLLDAAEDRFGTKLDWVDRV
ncbi:MAG TPA: helicase-related protein, partial [Thermoleophilia bacterium]|nr:helicase-related protein [Thermoleophilia bacterium]